MTAPLVALTGATGFLGAHLVRALDAAGFRVRVLARREPSPPGWGSAQPEIVPGDLSDLDALRRLADGAEVVVHNAGLIKAPDRARFLAVNRDGTARLAETARHARFLLVSSLAARRPELSAYAFSKHAGEEAARAVFGEALTIVRPPAIYGPGDRETFPVFQAAARSPVLPVLSPLSRLALIHVEDAARAIVDLATSSRPGSWALADGRPEGYGWREIAATAAAAVGRKPALIPAPPWLLPGIARIGAGAGLISKDKVGELLHTDWAVAPHEMAPGLATARFDLAQGFAATAAWYREAGWLR